MRQSGLLGLLAWSVVTTLVYHWAIGRARYGAARWTRFVSAAHLPKGGHIIVRRVRRRRGRQRDGHFSHREHNDPLRFGAISSVGSSCTLLCVGLGLRSACANGDRR